jgi:PASTA domain
VTNGGTATVTPAPLPDGTYHWQVRAQDLAGNQSGWSATRSFQIDSSAPTVPTLVSPADGAWLRHTDFQAVFSKPAFAGTGTIEFRICSDGACLGTVSSGSSPTLINGATAAWSIPDRMGEGLYWWQARAHDGAGNVSAWSPAWTFHVDKTPPPTPKNFNGHVAGDGLTLRWDPPADDSLANFYIYVNGVSTASLGVTTYEYKAGSFDDGDRREFAVVAVDHAGNQSPMSKTLVGVPNMVGLTLGEAEGAAKARGLAVHRENSIQSFGTGVVVSQNPAAGSVAEKGTAVNIVLETVAAPNLLTLSVSPARLICGAGAVVRLRLRLSERATVGARLVSGRRTVQRTKLGRLNAGTSDVRVKLPRHLARGKYKLALDATASARTAHTTVDVKAGARRACSAY